MPLEDLFLILALLAFGVIGWQLRGYVEDWRTEWEFEPDDDDDEKRDGS